MSDRTTSTADRTPRDRRRQLEALLRKKAEQARSFPVSFAQQRLWVLEQLDPGNPVYNIPLAIRMTGELCLDALGRTLNEVVARHESLRTRIATVDEQPVQIVEPVRRQELTVVDLQDIESASRESEAIARAVAELRRPFALDQSPLFRVLLLRLTPTEHILVVVMHHIISDDWSMGVLVREVALLYQAFRVDRPSPLPSLPIQYADYAAWQRKRLQGETLDQLIEYWQAQLQDVPPLDLPTDRPHSIEAQQAGLTDSIQLPLALLDQLRETARREGATLYMILLAAYQVLLARYSGQDDFAVGSPIAGRIGKDTEGLVGFFVNTLALRADLTGNPTFRELLDRVRQSALGAYQHQELPFERLVEALNPERDTNRHPIFQVTFSLENAPWPEAKLAGLALSVIPLDTGTSKFDLSFSAREQRDGLLLSAEYCSPLFQRSTIQRMLGHFQTLLSAVVANPDRPVSEVPLIDDTERRQLLVEWNNTSHDLPPQMVFELFEAQAAKTPDATALIDGATKWTYRELNERANQLAHHLQSRGVGPDRLVAVRLARSAQWIAALLAVAKAGGAYLPLDPQLPAQRLQVILDDAQADVIVTDTSLQDDLPAGRHLILLDAHLATIEARPITAPPRSVTADHLAYVIYTSGSTGRPKGVMIEHRAMAAYTHAAIAKYGIGETDRVLQFASASFDAHVEEVYPCLIRGGTLVLRNDDMLDCRQFVRLCDQWQLTVLSLPTGFWHELVATIASDGLTIPQTVRMVIIGGEQAVSQRVATWFDRVGDRVRLLNTYGPTETTVVATAAELSRADANEERVPIGQPMANMRAYVLDRCRQPVPVGVRGELYIGGESLARGYLNRPDLTAERFIADPFSEKPGARMYKTGDVVRHRADGRLEFIGRTDHQVKIRGFRIELGEIETVLRQHPGVQAAVVTAHDGTAGGKLLAAYIVANADAKPGATELRQFLGASLPDYMVPAAFVTLDAIPLNRNGKIDYKALPIPSIERDDQSEYVAPRTPDEQSLVDIWQDVLHVDQVGIHDNFFALGGHSLLATQLISRIAARLHVEVPLRDVFQTPTIAELAQRITALRTSHRLPGLPPIRPAGRETPLPMSYGQEAMWLISKLHQGPSPYVTFPAARVRGPLNVPALERALNEIIRRHESLRTTFTEIDGHPVQVFAPHTHQPLSVVDLSSVPPERQEEEVLRYAWSQSQRTIDLAKGPLARVELLKLADDHHVVLIGMHHIIYDGWSMAVLDRELLAAYRAFAAGLPSPLPELPIQYADYAVWQRDRLQGEVLSNLREYWLQQLASLPTLELATDRPRPAVRTTKGAACGRQLSHGLSKSIAQLSSRQRATPFMTLLAAFQTLLHRYTGQDDFPIGTPVAGRLRPETEGLIGYFINTLVLRADLSGDPTFSDLLGRVRETAVEAFDHQELPFERLVQELNPPRDPSRHPVFQVMFDFENTPFEAEELSELKMSGLDVERRELAADFDLALIVSENPEGIHLSLGYRTDLFDDSTISRMLDHFHALLEGVVADPQRRLSQLPLLSDQERHRMLVEWNDTQADFPQQTCLHELVEAQVERTPDAVAAVCDGRQLTYRQLNARANRLAHWLRRQGIGPDALVALHVDRTLDVVVGLLGILKAGGAFLPLDADLPTERIEYMLRDANVGVLVSQHSLVERLKSHGKPEGHAMPACIRLDSDWETVAEESNANPPHVATDRNLAYAIYTSGSTGRPKGVMIEHRSVVNVVTSFIRSYQVGPTDRVLQSASISFDVAVNEFFPALSTGATVVLPTKNERMDLDGLRNFVARYGVTIMAAAPTALARLNQLPDPLPGVRLVLSGGEALSLDDVSRLRETATVVNGYGPTEATICASSFPLSRESTLGRTTVPIGKPLANYAIYIVDTHSNCVPIGCPGELCIAGVGLARGYLNDKALTDRKFVPNPFLPGEPMYRTGDRARWLPDGNIEFLGRMDRQIKIRGYRIELGELEAILATHPAVEKAAVIDWQVAPGDQRLVAYCVLSSKTDTGEILQDIKQFLADKVPHYMVPSALISLDSLPLTSNGKIDRRALPQPNLSRTDTRVEYVAPQTPIQQQLAALWCEVLGVDRVGLRDNFFELGGHSLLALSLTSRVRDAMSVELPLVTLFSSPTLGEYAEQLVALQTSHRRAELPPIVSVPRDRALPASFGQEELWAIGQSARGPSPYIGHWAARLKGPFSVPAFERAIDEIWRRHESLRTTFAESNGQVVQVIAPHTSQQLDVVDLSELPDAERENEVARRVACQSQRPMDLTKGPLAHVELLKVDADEHVVLVTLHHIIYDGWSASILSRELLTAYVAFALGFPSPLEELPIQYADFAAWQRERLQGQVLDTLRTYWRQQLNRLPTLELPTDRPRPAVRTTHGAERDYELPSQLVQALERLSTEQGVTTFMTLMAAYQTLLHHYSGQTDFAVGTPVAGRLRPETENLIGYFINDLVLRADLTSDPSFRELMGRVRHTVVQAFDHQELPFVTLLGDLNPPHDPSRHPLIQAELILQNTPAESQEFPGLEVTWLGSDKAAGAAELDLAMEARQDDQGIHLSLTYRTDLFDAATIDSMLKDFRAILEEAVADPDRPLSQLLARRLPPKPKSRVSPQTKPTKSSVLMPLRAGTAATPVFCIHGLGGHVAGLMPLARRLTGKWPIFGLQGLGLTDGQQPHDCIQAMAACYVNEMRLVRPRGPYLLTGWSLGGIIAMEAAQQLTDAGEHVALLAMFDTYLTTPDSEQLAPDDQSMMRWIVPRLNLPAAELRKLPLNQQWARIAQYAELVEGIGIAEIRRLAAACMAHLTAASRYHPRAYHGRSVLFHAESGSATDHPHWSTLFPQLKMECVPGNHYTMLRKPHVDLLADRLDHYLAEAADASERVNNP